MILFIWVDIGMALIVAGCFAVGGLTVVDGLGIWVHQHFLLIILLLAILSVFKSYLFLNETKCSFLQGVICAVCDAFRMIPAGIFLYLFFSGFSELTKKVQ